MRTTEVIQKDAFDAFMETLSCDLPTEENVRAGLDKYGMTAGEAIIAFHVRSRNEPKRHVCPMMIPLVFVAIASMLTWASMYFYTVVDATNATMLLTAGCTGVVVARRATSFLAR